MKPNSIFNLLPLAFVIALMVLAPLKSSAQDFEDPSASVEYPVEVIASFKVKKDTREGMVSVTAKIHPLWHVFSVTQKKKGPIRTTIKVTDSPDFKITGPFAPDSIPHVTQVEGFSVPVEEHLGQVIWSAPIEISDGVNPETLTIKVRLAGQTCENKPFGFCKLVSERMVAEFDGYVDALALATTGETPAHTPTEEEPPQEDDHSGLKTIKDSPEEIAEMGKLYEVDTKVKYLNYTEMDASPIGSGGTSSSNNTTFMTALIGAFLGGMLLNLMPCVFPVLGLKVMGFVMQAGSEPKKIRMHGIAFAFGLLVSMWILAGIIMTIRNSFGQDINWGAQMGNPYFVGSIIILLYLLGLNMAGVFEIGTSLSSVGGGGQKKGYSGSFFSGILTTLIATPCSGPFLGVAMSYTMAQPTGIAMFLFTIFGLGIAFPYLLLSFFPALIKALPKPGPWMETFKVTMAFALFATVAFFMQAFGGQTGVGGLSWMVMALVVIGLAAYFYGHWSEANFSFGKKVVWAYLLPTIIAGVGLWMAYDATNQRQTASSSHSIGGLAWQDWNPGKIEYSLAKKKKIIWVDYTADW